MNRPLLAVCTAAILAASLLAWSLSPDTGPPPQPAPRQASLDAPAPAALPAPAPSPPARGPVAAHTPDRPLTRLPQPHPPVDPNQVFVADLKGLASAAVTRRERFVACWEQYRRQAADDGYDGRLTVKITVYPDGARGVPETEVVNGPQDAEFHDCMAGVMRDAKFESPGEAPFSMMWPVPISGETRTPRRDLIDPVPFSQGPGEAWEGDEEE